MLKVAFAGTPDFAAVALKGIMESAHNVIAVLTQPDRPAGRGQKLHVSPVKTLAMAQGIPILQPVTLKDERALAEVQALQADVIVVAAYGLLLPHAVLAAPRLGCINIHASLLPRWRGAAPIQRAIIAGDTQTGITIMQMDAGLDTGPVLSMSPCNIESTESGGSLHNKLATLGSQAIVHALNELEAGTLTPRAQAATGVTYAAKLTKKDAQIEWNQSAFQIDRLVRAFNPWPTARTVWRGNPLLVWKMHALAEQSSAAPGTLVAIHRDGIDVACGQGQARLQEIQLPGGKRISVADFLNSRQLEIGERFASA